MRKKLLLSALFMAWAVPCFAQQVDTAWVQRYNGPGNNEDEASAIAVDDSGNVYVTGWSVGSGTYSDYATIKYDKAGNQLWVRRYNGPGNNYDEASAIAVDGSGNVYVTGFSTGSGIFDDYATVKYDSIGTQLWVKTYNGSGNAYDEATRIALDDSGNVYVTGWSVGSGTGWDYATITYDPAGNQVWAQRYNGPGNSADVANAIAVDGSSNVYVTGSSVGSGTSPDYATLKYDASGNQLWAQRYNGPGDSTDYALAIAVDGSGNVYVTGYSLGSGTSYDYTTIKYWQNSPLSSFSLLAPLDSVYSSIFTTLDWADAIDPDPWDTVRYNLYLSTSPAFQVDSTVIYDSLLTSTYTDTLEIGRYYWKVKAHDKRAAVWSTETWTFLALLRGDANGDKKLTVSDVIYIINYLFKGGPTPSPFLAGDVNCDGHVTVADVVYLVNYLFKGGPAPGC